MSRYDIPDSDPPERAQNSFAAAAAHFIDATGRMSKRATLLFACVGLISTVSSSAIAIWVAQHGFVTEDKMARQDALLREIDRKLDLMGSNVSSQGGKIANLESWDRTQDDRIASKRDKK